MAYLISPIIEQILVIEILIFIFINSAFVFLFLNFRNRRKSELLNIAKLMPVSIIIPAYNKEKEISKTIKSVLNIDYPEKEIIVVNDESKDRTKKICEKFQKEGKIKFIDQKHGGKWKALNTGIKAAKNKIVVTVDADSMPEKNSLKKLVRHFQDKNVGAVAGTIKADQPKKILSLLQGLEYLFMNFQRMCQSFISAILVCPGPLTAYRKVAIEKVGYFDNDTLVEDYDMTIKLQKSGYRVAHEKKAIVRTIVPLGLKGLWKQRIRWGRGGIQVLKKHRDVIFNRKYKMLGIFSFPISMIQMAVTVLLIGTFLVYSVPNFILSLQNLILNFSFNPLLLTNITLIYAAIETVIINVFALNNLNLVISLGYVSVSMFFLFVFLSFRGLGENFKPKDLKSLIAITGYWFLLIIIFMNAFILELFKRKKKW